MLAKKTTDRRKRRTTRIDLPTVEEAITAAQGLTDQIEDQIQIAAQLIGLPEEDVRPAVLKAAAQMRGAHNLTAPVRPNGAKVVVVERKRPRIGSR